MHLVYRVSLFCHLVCCIACDMHALLPDQVASGKMELRHPFQNLHSAVTECHVDPPFGVLDASQFVMWWCTTCGLRF